MSKRIARSGNRRQQNRTALENGFLGLFQEEVADYTRDRIRAFSRGTELDIAGLERSIWKGLEEVAAEMKALRGRIQSLNRKIRAMEQDPAHDQNFEDTLQQLLREKSAMNEIVRSMNERMVLNFFTDEGLLPNYAFPEAGVILRSVIYRRNQKAEDDERKYKAGNGAASDRDRCLHRDRVQPGSQPHSDQSALAGVTPRSDHVRHRSGDRGDGGAGGLLFPCEIGNARESE